MELPGPQARVASRAPEKQEEGLRGGVRLKVARLNPSPGRAPGRRLAETAGSELQLREDVGPSAHAQRLGLETGSLYGSGQTDSPQGRDTAVPLASGRHVSQIGAPGPESDRLPGSAGPVAPEADPWVQKQQG